MRTKQEVINFLESKVGTKVPCPGRKDLEGQCVTLIKSLMEFLGVPDPYKARGHAKTAISAYLSEGIASNGVGFLSVFSNKNMGGGYGHIWCNAGDGDGVFYESNGVKPLIVTKGKTYSYDAVCNFDKYIKGESMSTLLPYLGVKDEAEAKTKLKEHLGEKNGKCNWGETGNGGHLGSERAKNADLTSIIKVREKEIDFLEDEIKAREKEIAKLSNEVDKQGAIIAQLETEIKELNKTIKDLQNAPTEELGALQLITLTFKAITSGKW